MDASMACCSATIAEMVWPMRLVRRPSPKFSVIEITSTPTSASPSSELKNRRMLRARRAILSTAEQNQASGAE
ncbi:hypothetical protein WH159_13010 [Sphingomonas molluscorum]|uniref:Uncharacterized protein n=1 Tax=Sphingomonas molluscorum TaxID=418184 RepID=A0ABU8Q7F6_9SPHN|nr:hypothetical protein [Sphingomonas sp. JUb134]